MMTRRSASALVALAALTTSTGKARPRSASPMVPTTHGPVIGTQDGPTQVFKGVRYGADTHSHRFQPPRRPTPWTQPVEALTYGAACFQNADEPDQSEDCLFLNVWRPAQSWSMFTGVPMPPDLAPVRYMMEPVCRGVAMWW